MPGPYNKLPECEGCTLHDQPGICWGSGDPKTAKLIYIAQNPGQHEVAAQPMEPLVGASGNVFNKQLFEAGISRSELFVTNQVKCLTPLNREPTALEISKCRPLLQRELDRCKADTVILAGAVPFKANIGTYSTIHPSYHPPDNVLTRMGCVEQKDGRKWIGTIHPAFLMRMPDFRHEATIHLKKAWAIAGLDIPKPYVDLDPSPEVIAEHKAAAFARKQFADDTESFEMPYDINEDDYVGGMWRPDLCGFSAIPYKAFVVRFNQVAEVWHEVFQDETITQFEHNGEHDRYDLEKISPQRNIRFDTMLGHHWLHNNVFKYLKPHTLRYYTNLPYYDRSLEKVNRRLYCGMDNITTLLAGREQIRQLKQILIPEKYKWGNVHTMYDLLLELGFPVLSILEEQRVIGARTNTRKMFLYKKITLAQVEKGESLIAKMLGPFFNWKSPAQKCDLWYKKWGLPPQYNIERKGTKKIPKGTKKLTTDDDARVRLRRWIASLSPKGQEKFKQAKIFFDLLDFTSEKKKLAEYFDRVSPDERVHTHWKPHAETFRAKSTPNFQNWPSWRICCGEPICKCGANYDSVRSIVIPDTDDDVFLAIDFDQIELWTYAVQFGIKWLLDVYASGDYIYGMIAEDVLKEEFFQPGKPRTKKYRLPSVTDQRLLRYKAIPLGFLYGRQGESVAAEHNWPAQVGRNLRTEWFRKNPELPKAHNEIEYHMKQKGFLQPAPGVILNYPTPDPQGLNCFGQTSAAFMLYKSIIDCDRAFKRRGWSSTRTVLSVHDSILFNIGGGRKHPERVEEVYEGIIKPILSQPVPWFQNISPGFRYKHEAKVGVMWDWGMSSYDSWKELNCSTTVTK